MNMDFALKVKTQVAVTDIKGTEIAVLNPGDFVEYLYPVAFRKAKVFLADGREAVIDEDATEEIGAMIATVKKNSLRMRRRK